MPRSSGLKSPAKMLSRSAPTSPKNLKDLTKSSTLPQAPQRSDSNVKSSEGTDSSSVPMSTAADSSSSSMVGASPARKSRNATFSNFFKKLSPKLRQSGSSKNRSDKTWYVVEIAQRDIDETNTSDLRTSIEVPSSSSRSSDSEIVRTSKEESNERKGSFEAKVQQVNASFGTQPVIKINSTGSAAPITQTADSLSASGVATSQLPLSGPRVRRTHQPPRTLNILNKIVVQHPYELEKVKGKMTSVESIGSCSLDVDATASESSATADGRASSVSQRTLHSTSVDLGSGVSNILEGIQMESVRSPRTPTRISVKNSGASGSDVRYISELYIPNGRVRNVDEGGADDHNDQRKPSYINISCSVSGYTSYSCYNSKVREGLRSRDNSPARLAFTTVANGDGSSQILGRNVDEREVNGVSPKVHTNVVLLNVNGGGNDVVDRCSRRSMYEETTASLSSTLWRASSEDGILSCHSKENEVHSYKERRSETRAKKIVTTTANERICESEAFNNNNNNGDVEHGSETKSLIQQRIERLYGPSVLAQGFRLHRERRCNGETSNVSKASEVNSYPPVFKHLCPTFYDQLVTSHSSTSPVISPLKSVHSPKASVVADAKCEETSAQEIRSNGDISKHNGFHVETEQMLKQPFEEEILVVTNDHKRLDDEESNVKDGKWFIEIMNMEQSKIKLLILRAEEHLKSDSPPEEACGRLRAAIGKANLLLSQKFQQFRGLCEKNLTQSSSEPFPTTVSDLAGFWDMVLIQVQEIHKMFDDIEKMRECGWIVNEMDEAAAKAKSGGDSLTQLSSSKTRRIAVKKPTNVVGGRSTKADEAARTREEARKRLLEAKRKGRQQTSTNDNSVIKIFLPEDKD